MPQSISILYKTGNDYTKNLACYSCCQFLHTVKTHFSGLVPMKYFLSHKDITKTYIKWLEFLKKNFEVELKYELIPEFPVKGWLTFADMEEIYKWLKEDYHIGGLSIEKHRGVLARVNATYFQYNRKVFYMANYNSSWLNSYVRGDNNKQARYDPRIKEYLIPMMNIKMPKVEEEALNSLKYFDWFLIRFFAEYQPLAHFLIDNEEELNILREEYELEWYNILFALGGMNKLGGTIGLYISSPVTREGVKEALYTSLEKRVESNIRRSKEQGRIPNEKQIRKNAPFDRDICIDSSIIDHFNGMIPKQKAIIDSKLSYIDDWYDDNVHGKFSEKENKTMMSKVNFYIKTICTQ